MKWAVVLLALVVPADLFSQIGYPGGYPPGGHPGSGPGIPMPWPRKGKGGGADSKPASEALTRVNGKLRRIDEKTIVVEAADDRVVQFRREAKTRFYKESEEIAASQLKAGDEVSVEGTEDKEGNLSARTVRLDKSATAAEAAGAESSEADKTAPATADAPTPPVRDPSDPGPPVLQRGGAPRRHAPEIATDSDAATPRAEAAQTPAEGRDPVIEKARGAAQVFSEKLPNYVCKQFMARYMSTSRPVDWRPLDVVSTEVVYEGDKESYRNVEINGKPVNKPMEEIGGSWSTGEFGTVLLDLFSPLTAADFRFRKDSIVSGIEAKVYDFSVERPRSHWHVQVPSQSINPAYEGSVWIDPKSGRVLRIEMQARALPEEFPLDTVESAVDYAKVRIGEGEFLLPVRAENLSCQRGTSNCSRNTIDFRNYHKYNADSSITFANEK